MPDESCRKYGNKLYDFSKCSECRISYIEICLKCGQKTLPKYHDCMISERNVAICGYLCSFILSLKSKNKKKEVIRSEDFSY
ncbi:hypothetical protein C5F50_03480 [Nitrosopumilus ureiphilus]|uniref:Uncharacterized protein n=1 Tax=Nitrosopumilus ureiphilus TaxID=1470067 RepID=A0A7D5RAL0_9ARCH|nr:hypothetical protein C5F50_03480 [Nitrosopumilus ureiphilus]